MEQIRWGKMWEDTRRFFTAPVELYQNLEKEGGYLEPIVYTILMSFIAEIILVLSFMLFHFKLLFFTANILVCIFFVPFFLVPFFVSTIILHIIWTLLGSKESFETSLRCSASFAPLFPAGILISAIPFFGKWIGTFVYLFAFCFYIILASIHVHKVDETKAKNVFIIIFVVVAFLRMVNIIGWEVREKRMKRKTDDMIRQIEENYQKQMEEYEKRTREQQKMYEEYQKQSQQNYPVPVQ